MKTRFLKVSTNSVYLPTPFPSYSYQGSVIRCIFFSYVEVLIGVSFGHAVLASFFILHFFYSFQVVNVHFIQPVPAPGHVPEES
jgi:hypothetical protein